MDMFNYLSVLFSVILGLALTEILQGFRRLILARERVVVYWPALIWAGLMFLVVAQAWWGMFGMRDFREWTFAMYGVVLIQITFMYLVAGIAAPEVPPQGAVDMEEDYFAHSRWFFGLLSLTVVTTFIKDIVNLGRVSSSWNAYYLEFFLLMAVLATITKSRWFHWFLAPFATVLFLVYTAFLSFRL